LEAFFALVLQIGVTKMLIFHKLIIVKTFVSLGLTM
jgi:hypothetical protein